jgi:hypothetical protein
VDLLQRVHHAQEALIPLEREPELWGWIEEVSLRLEGAQGMSSSLAPALVDVAVYLDGRHPKQPDGQTTGPIERTAPWLQRAPGNSVSSLPPIADLDEARVRLRQVVSALNEFRDGTWASLIRLRNRTLAALILTEVFAYGLLALAVGTNVGRTSVATGVAYFLVGALIGYVARLIALRATRADNSDIDDYGLEFSRLLLVFMISGLAAVAGVALTLIGSTSPTIGQSYLIDAFLVVVVGGLGQIKGTVIAAFALGFLNSFIEYSTTASLAKVIVFVIIVVFLQVRPQGLFTVRTRSLA